MFRIVSALNIEINMYEKVLLSCGIDTYQMVDNRRNDFLTAIQNLENKGLVELDGDGLWYKATPFGQVWLSMYESEKEAG